MKKYGVGIVGTGWVSGEHIRAYQNNPHTEVLGLCSRMRETAQKRIDEFGLKEACIYTDYERMLKEKDIHIISICTPNHLHPEETILAAQAGKHILIEKPVALNMKDLLRMKDAVSKVKVKTVVSFVLRWNPLFTIIKSLLKEKFFGDLFYGGVDYLHGIGPWYKQYQWNIRESIGGSSLLSAGCHAVDAIRWFIQDEAVEVVAYSNTSRGNPLKYEYHPNTTLLVRFKKGVIGKVTSSIEYVGPYVFNIELSGNGGSIRNNRVYSKKMPGQKNYAEIPTILPGSGDVTHHPFQGEIDHLVDCILENRESHVNLEDAVKTHEIIFAADISSKYGGKRVKLPL